MPYNPIVKVNPGSVTLPKRVQMGQKFDMNVSNPTVSFTKDGKSSSILTEDTPDYLQAISGGIGMASDFLNISNQKLNLGNPNYDFGEVPTYNLGNYVNSVGAAKAKGADAGEVLSGVGKGAEAGSAFGVPGAIIGGVVGGVSNLIGGGVRKRRQQREIRKARRKAFTAQQNYNEAASEYNTNQMAQQEYYRNINPYEREAALY